MKNFFKKWKWYEWMFLGLSWLAITICFLVTKEKNYLSFSFSIIGIFSVICTAKALVITPFIDIFYNSIYLALSITEKLYGETIACITLMFPLTIWTLVSWLKNKSPEDKEIVKVNKVKTKEYLILLICIVPLSFGFYYLLKALNTSELVVSTISIVTAIVASYLTLRRSSYYAVAYIVCDVVLAVLWGVSAKQNPALLPSAISFLIFLFNDIYGFVHWKIQEKKQQKNELENLY